MKIIFCNQSEPVANIIPRISLKDLSHQYTNSPKILKGFDQETAAEQ